MFRLSDIEYVLFVRPGSAPDGQKPGYLYIEGRVSQFFQGTLETLENQMLGTFDVSLPDSKASDRAAVWKNRLTMVLSLCQSSHFSYEKLDSVGLNLRRLRSGVSGSEYCFLVPGCQWLFPVGDYGSSYENKELVLVFYGSISDSFKSWLKKVDARFKKVGPEWGFDSDRFREAVFTVMDKAGAAGIGSVLLPVTDLEWLKSHASLVVL